MHGSIVDVAGHDSSIGFLLIGDAGGAKGEGQLSDEEEEREIEGRTSAWRQLKIPYRESAFP